MPDEKYSRVEQMLTRSEIEASGDISSDIKRRFPAAHFCPNWDWHLIVDADQEMDYCGCEDTAKALRQ